MLQSGEVVHYRPDCPMIKKAKRKTITRNISSLEEFIMLGKVKMILQVMYKITSCFIADI